MSDISVSYQAKHPLKTMLRRPSTLSDDVHVERVHAKMRENHRLIVREIAEEVRINKSSCHTILSEKLNMHRIAAKFVPRLLTDEQKEKQKC